MQIYLLWILFIDGPGSPWAAEKNEGGGPEERRAGAGKYQLYRPSQTVFDSICASFFVFLFLVDVCTQCLTLAELLSFRFLKKGHGCRPSL